jgi:hypothetical protein
MIDWLVIFPVTTALILCLVQMTRRTLRSIEAHHVHDKALLVVHAGDVLLQRPLIQLVWCLNRRKWPGLLLLSQCAAAVVWMPFLRSNCSHVLQCIEITKDKIVCVHTTLGRVVQVETYSPGYIETCSVVPLHAALAKLVQGEQRLKNAFQNMVGIRVSVPWFFATPLVRANWIDTAARMPHESRFRLHNCTHLVVLGWLECGQRLFEDPIQGVYPDDFKRLVDDVHKDQHVVYCGNEIHPGNVVGLRNE